MSVPSMEPQPSVPMLTFTPALSSARMGARPEPTFRFEGGLCWMVTPVRAMISISRGFSQMPWMKAVFGFMNPMRSRYSIMVEP